MVAQVARFAVGINRHASRFHQTRLVMVLASLVRRPLTIILRLEEIWINLTLNDEVEQQ